MDVTQLGRLGLIVLGVVFLGASIFFFIRTRRFLRSAVTTEGVVVDHATRSAESGGTLYHDIVQYMTPDGRSFTVKDPIGSYPPNHQIGEKVPVKYSPSNPEDGRFASTPRIWFLTWLFAIAGLSAVGFGIPWYLSGSDASPASSASPAIPATIPTTVVPSGPATGAATFPLQVQDDGEFRSVAATCEGLDERKKGNVVEVRLGFEGETLSFTVSRFRGPGAYPAHQGVKVEGSFLDGADVAGAVVFGQTEVEGAVNLAKGARAVSGGWSCAP